MFDDMFEKDGATKMVNDEVSCDKYKYNSCPKEIIDFLNQVYQQEIKNVDPGRSFYPHSALSDFAEKSRGNGIKEAFYHFSLLLFIGIFGVIGVYDFIEKGSIMASDGKFNIPITGILSILLIFLLSSFSYLHFYWYGKLDGMKLGTSSEQVIKSTWNVFIKWYSAFFAIFVFLVSFIINMPKIILYLLITFGSEMKAHEQVYRAAFGSFYDKYFNFLHNFNDDKIMTFVLVVDGFFIFSVLLSILFSYLGFKKGKNEQLQHNQEEREIEKDKMEYVFDRTLKELKDF